MITLMSSREIDLMSRGGTILAATLGLLKSPVRAGISTQELDALAEALIRSHPAKPAFQGLYGFPASGCTSIHEEILPGILGQAGAARATWWLDVGVSTRVLHRRHDPPFGGDIDESRA